jgi:hypothetical protein
MPGFFCALIKFISPDDYQQLPDYFKVTVLLY